MDQIIISGLEVYAHHGVLAEEKINGQPFILDITLGMDLGRACEDDCLSSTVDYNEVCRLAGDAMTDETFDLIERAAQHVADTLLGAYEAVKTVDITLKKPFAPLCRKVGYVAVSIRRER